MKDTPTNTGRITEEQFRSQLRKTRPCLFFSEGRCRFGVDCTFAHGEVAHAPDLTKTSLCRDWKKRKCHLSSAKCSFAHGSHELHQTHDFKQAVKELNQSRLGNATQKRTNGDSSGRDKDTRPPAPSVMQVPIPFRLTQDQDPELCQLYAPMPVSPAKGYLNTMHAFYGSRIPEVPYGASWEAEVSYGVPWTSSSSSGLNECGSAHSAASSSSVPPLPTTMLKTTKMPFTGDDSAEGITSVDDDEKCSTAVGWDNDGGYSSPRSLGQS